MSKPEPAPKRIEIDMEDLRKMLADEPQETKDRLKSQINRFDRSHESFQLRDKTTELYAQRGLNVQQHSIMKGFMKWQGTMHQMAYNLSLGLSISLGGIDKAVNAMRGKSWFEKNGALVVILALGASMYFGFIYSPDFRVWLSSFFEPLSTKIGLAVALVLILFVWWRTRRRAQAA